jgi:alpha-aminoadipic semialdehyde synthase
VRPAAYSVLRPADIGIATDASQHFSSRILPYVRYLAGLPVPDHSTDVISQSLDCATIIKSGSLKRDYEWLLPDLAKVPTVATKPSRPTGVDSGRPVPISSQKKRVLLLGSGLVAGPAVEVFAARHDVQLHIGKPYHGS